MCSPDIQIGTRYHESTSHAQMTRIHPVYECAPQRAARIDTILTEVNGWITSRLREISFPRERNMEVDGVGSLLHTYTISPLVHYPPPRFHRTNTLANIYQENSYFNNLMNFLLIFCILFSFLPSFLFRINETFFAF